MKSQIEVIFNILVYLAIIGNVIFIIWITFNGVDEGFSGNILQKVSYISLVILLILNIILLFLKINKNN